MNPDIPLMVRKLRDGDENAFCGLYRIYGGRVYSTAKRMGLAKEDAEEIVQEVFLKIWSRRSGLKDELSFQAYLIAILKTLVYKRAKKVARMEVYRQYASYRSEPQQNEGEIEMAYQDIRRFSNYALASLPKSQKEIVEMKYFQHLSADEISAKLSISKRTVETHLYKATKTIRERILGSKTLPTDLFPVMLAFVVL